MYIPNFGNPDESKQLAFDLRQGLAKRLNEHQDAIAKARVEKNFELWLVLLDSLYMEVAKKLEEEEMATYETLLQNVNSSIEENPNAFSKPDLNGKNIYSALKSLNVWLERKMEKYKMFGGVDDELDGL